MGGAEKLVTEIAPLIRDKGIEVDVLSISGEMTPFMRILEEKNIKVLHLGIKCNVYNPFFAFRIIKIIKDYDIVHTHNTASQYFVAFASMFCKTNTVTTEHSTSTRRRRFKFFKYFDRWMYRRYDSIICISEPSKQSLVSYIGKGYPILIIKNGINIKSLINAVPVNLDINANRVITMVAGFRYEKDQPTVINALKYLPYGYQVVLVGDGERRKEFENLIKINKLDERVHLLGIRTDVPRILKASDVIVMSSHREGLSLSNVEGMSVGKPFIASDVEGLREVTKGYGLLFPEGNSKVLASLIEKVCTDDCYANDISMKCLERAKEYDIEKMVNQYIDVYNSIYKRNK